MSLLTFLLPKPETSVTLMHPDHKTIIRKFAEGNVQLKDEAIRIHRAYMSILGVRGTVEQRFMAEVDSPVPDLALRAQYRDQLLKQEAN